MHAVDFPNERKIHNGPVARVGGMAMAIGALIPTVVWISPDRMGTSILIGAGIIILFGMIDDMKGLGCLVKFTGQLMAAGIVVFYGGLTIRSLGTLLPENVLIPDPLAIFLTLVVVVGVTNAINLADGLDGLAGGISMLGFICIGYLAYRSDNSFITLLSCTMVGAIFGFLRYNSYPAVVFMGDTGSQLLGFLTITLSLGLTQGNGPVSPLVPLLLVGFPVLDTLTVMVERISAGRSPFTSDQNHFHHKLMRLGLYHTEAVTVIYLIQIFLVTVAFMLRFYSEWILLSLYLVLSVMVITGFACAGRYGWQVKRYAFIDTVIKGKLGVLKRKKILIKTAQSVMEAGLPLLLFFTCLITTQVPMYVSVLSLVLVCLLFLTCLFKKGWIGIALRLSLYLSVPFMVYLVQTSKVQWINGNTTLLHNLAFGFLVFFAMLTLKYTQRQKGFKTTPMDFLIFAMAILIPLLPGTGLHENQLGFIGVKIIVFFFCYEVLIGELRGELNRLGFATIAALAVVSLKGLL